MFNVPTVLVVFGATGDLMQKKIIPALYSLFITDRLPKFFQIVAYARRPLTDIDYRDHVQAALSHYYKDQLDEAKLSTFLERFSYHQGTFESLVDYTNLAEHLGRIDGEWRVCSNKLFYLSVPPHYYDQIFDHLKSSHLTDPCSDEVGWTRVLVEKPFGDDLATARRLDTKLAELFKEEQIYRIDHYLAKEMLQNILSFRFSNNLFESAWDSRSIERIEIRLLEDIGVEDRGSFYDGVGALRDVGQNHLLQMLALVTMEHPQSYSPAAVRQARAEAISHIRSLTDEEIPDRTYRAQYEGYRQIQGVRADSATETYFKVCTSLNSARWAGVPIVLESGKRMGQVLKEIIVTFKHPQPCLCPPEQERHYQNRVVFQLAPEESIRISFFSKKPGFTMEMEERSFEFCLNQGTKPRAQYVEEYAKLLLDSICGDQTLFISTEEVKAMWQAIDPIVQAWERNRVPLHSYPSGTEPGTGPEVKINLMPFGDSRDKQPNSSIDSIASQNDHRINDVIEQVTQELPEKPSIEMKTKEVIEPIAESITMPSARQMNKQIAVVGLGKMGSGLARHLLEKGWRVVGYNRSSEDTKALEAEGLVGAYELAELTELHQAPRIIWLMLPAGPVIDQILFEADGLIHQLEPGDIVIDAGNSYYKDSLTRSEKLAARGIEFIDVGFSGGPAGARHGASLMIGGHRAVYELLEPLWQDLSVPDGHQFFEGPGAGHFVKMIHNGIEYGMMQAIAEGFTILKRSPYQLNLLDVAKIYNHGSVIESRLIEWLEQALTLHGQALNEVSGTVGHTGEADWTVRTAEELGLEAKVIEAALAFRVLSEKKPNYTGRILSALREQFGGHSIN